MAAVLDGIRVLDLTSGIAGPMSGMLLADHGAEVIKVEQPGGDPSRSHLGSVVWNRGKQSVELDLTQPTDRDVLLNLARGADVLIESYTPGRTDKLGIDYASLSQINPRLIYCSITGYGRDNEHSQRPAIDALVAARTGLHFEQRGWPEGALNHLAGREDPYAEVEIPNDWVQGADREGPLFTASHWPSLGAFFNAVLGISAALRAREKTGRGQWVETSLMQGALAGAAGVWMRAENIDVPGFDSWILGNRSPKGHFKCKDGRWLHNWVPNPRFILQASEGETLNASPDLTVQNDPDRFGTGPEELLVMTHYQPILAEAVARFDCDDWIDAAAKAEMTMQECRSVEASLADPLLLEDGCVRQTEDPQLGPIRSVGVTYNLSANPSQPGARSPAVGEHNDAVRKLAESLAQQKVEAPALGDDPDAPLKGITVLDLGLAIAGPFGTQLLSDLGATVIKINGLYDLFWHRVHIAYMANRGKQSITLNLKDPRSMEVFLKLVDSADVVHHNMRYDAAERLKIDYESLKARKPDLIYCHTRGFEKGPRQGLPGNDQTGACLSGIQFEDGGLGRGEGHPLWSFTSFGDTGNGFLSAIGVIQALYHRDRTGEGQMVDTSIINAALLNTSYAVAKPDGGGFERPQVDPMQWGFSAGHRIYPTSKGWICLALQTEQHWSALAEVCGLAGDARLADATSRKQNDAGLCEALEKSFAGESAEHWFAKLDAVGVPVEVEGETFSLSVHENPYFRERQWVTSYDHPHVGKLDQIGFGYTLSETPGVIQGRPLIVGEHTESILKSFGYDEDTIKTMEEQFAIGFAGMPRMPPQMKQG